MRETEKVFLSQCIQNPNILLDTRIVAKDFTDSLAQNIFTSMKAIQKKGYRPDSHSVAQKLKVDVQVLFDIEHTIPTTGNSEYFEQIILKESRRRRCLHAVENFKTNDSLDVEDLKEQITKIEESKEVFSSQNNIELAEETLNLIKERKTRYEHGQPLIGITTGLSSLDKHCGGFQKGRFYAIGARPSQGKTALLLNFFLSAKVPAGFISVESSKTELVMRMISQQSHVSSEEIQIGNLANKNMSLVEDAANYIRKNLAFEIFDKPNADINEIERVVYQMRRRFGIKILFVDYLQNINASGFRTKIEQVTEVSKRLKDIARTYNIPVVCAAQLNRDVQNNEPNLWNFSDSSQIEKDADVAILIHHDENGATLKIAKNRDGRLSKVLVNFYKEILLFSE